MRIRHLSISNFRGIKSLDWTLKVDFCCLLGPGDSGKSTILDAIEMALSPRWNLPFDDNDFYKCDTVAPIEINVTLTDIPDSLIAESKFGLMLRGWSQGDELNDEPAENDEKALTIRLIVDATLEPTWTATNERRPEGKPISGKDRAKLGCARLGTYVDRHLSWSQGSIVSRLTEDSDAINGLLAEATRAVRGAMDPTGLDVLSEAAKKAQVAGSKMGIIPADDYIPHVDLGSISVAKGSLALHEGKVPVRMAGLGTGRLLTIGIQRELGQHSGVALIDEIEMGLEPHRLRRLLLVLRDSEPNDGTSHQSIVTTHSPTVVSELLAEQLFVVRCQAGIASVVQVPTNAQGVVRRAPEALLAPKILVCEGKTELGVCRGLKDWWIEDRPDSPSLGVALADGQGRTQGPGMAIALSGLGYRVAYLGDTDAPLEPNEATMRAAGVEVVVWDAGKALEDRLVSDLPWGAVAEMVTLALDYKELQSVRDAVASRVGAQPNELVDEPIEWNGIGKGEGAVREAVSKAAMKHGWFKTVDRGERLSSLVRTHWEEINGTDLWQKLSALKVWAESDV
jgi:putative ATP-dependent endonuclease of the OLD family